MLSVYRLARVYMLRRIHNFDMAYSRYLGERKGKQKIRSPRGRRNRSRIFTYINACNDSTDTFKIVEAKTSFFFIHTYGSINWNERRS
jgi:hypothetical protein